MSKILAATQATWHRLTDNRDGSIAVVSALCVMLLFGFAGMAFDLVRGHNARTQAQAALDAAVLSAVRGKFQTNSPETVQQTVAEYFKKNFTVTDLKSPPRITATVTDKGTIRATANFEVAALLMGVLGSDNMDIEVRSAVGVAGSPVEVALVLDTTGSMSGAKMTALKESAERLLDILYSANDAQNLVKVSVVPFAEYVNVGTSKRNESWMDVPSDGSTSTYACHTVTKIIGQTNCRMETFTGSADGTPYTYQAQVCDYQYGPPVEECSTDTTTIRWYGCAGSRNYPLNTQDGGYSTRIPGVMNVSCGSEILPLTNSRSTVSSAISALGTAGETYIPAGLIWGWRVLSSQEPYSEGAQKGSSIKGAQVRKIVVLMSDGANTRSPVYPYHNGWDASQANTLTAETCSNMKADGIEIYSVAFEVIEQSARDLMRDCATSTGHFFDARQRSELVHAFESIAISMQSLALAE